MKFTTSLFTIALACSTASAIDLATEDFDSCQVRQKVVWHLLDGYKGFENHYYDTNGTVKYIKDEDCFNLNICIYLDDQ